MLLVAVECGLIMAVLYVVQESHYVLRLYFIRPPDIVCRRTYILPVFLLLLSLFRQLISEVAERN